MYKNIPNKVPSKILNDFMPISNAVQTTEVFVKDNKLKMQIHRREITAEELIN